MKMNKKEKLEKIFKLVKSQDLTAYQIAKQSKLSTLAIQNILNGTTKNPTEKTLIDILEAIEALQGNNPSKKEDYTKSVERELIETQKILLKTQKEQIELLKEKIATLKTEKSQSSEVGQ